MSLPSRPVTARTFAAIILIGAAASLVALVIGAMIGSVPVAASDLWGALSAGSGTGSTIVRDVRLPRILLAFFVGAGLGVSGNALQVMLRNPLAEPYVLGISNGCAVGVIVGSLVHLGALGLAGCGFLGGLLVTFIVFRWAMRGGVLSAESLLLAGVMIAALGAALIFLALAVAGDTMRATLGWLLGNLGQATWGDVPIAGSVVIAGSAALLRIAPSLNALAVGEEFAHQAGVHVPRVQRSAYLVSSLIVGTLVSLVGAVGFVGLLIPHAVRGLVGSDNRLVVPAAFFAGGVSVVLADALSRSVIPGVELPIGAVTALLGAPMYLWMLRKK